MLESVPGTVSSVYIHSGSYKRWGILGDLMSIAAFLVIIVVALLVSSKKRSHPPARLRHAFENFPLLGRNMATRIHNSLQSFRWDLHRFKYHANCAAFFLCCENDEQRLGC